MSLSGQFKSSVVEKNMLLLAPFFAYMGLIVSFLMGVYPTTLAFTAAHSTDIYIVAIYSMAMGSAEIFGGPVHPFISLWLSVVFSVIDITCAVAIPGGVVLRRLIKKCQDWGLVVTISIHFLAIFTMLVLVVLSVPEMATMMPTSEPPLLIKPR